MHEIPPDLAKSLRSYRGSVHSKSPAPKSPSSDAGSEKDNGPNTSSLILHPTASNQQLNHTARLHKQMRSPASPYASTPPPLSTAPAKSSPKANSDKPLVMASPIDPDPIAEREKDNKEPLTEPDFYKLMGMQPPPRRGQSPKKLGATHGLYTTILSRYNYVNKKYRIYDVIVYVFLVLQIILAAIFIILGALRNIDSHTAVATLGAVSTVIGGVLALMKGQGLPNRLRMTKANLQKVLFEAEELYHDVGAGRQVLYSDIRKVREDYLRVMDEENKNHPDTWNAATPDATQGAKGLGGKTEQMANGKPTAPSPKKTG